MSDLLKKSSAARGATHEPSDSLGPAALPPVLLSSSLDAKNEACHYDVT